ncbi:MAG: hypothetical protein WA672_05455 [Candidatus Angelobacter sp.]
MKDFLAFLPILSIVIAFTALFVSLRDRWPHLELRARKGDWCKLDETVDGKELIFRGIIEVYNISSRANAIHGYEFWSKREGDNWEKMESERYDVESFSKGIDEVSNKTPLTLAPYSGSEVSIIAVGKMPKPKNMQVRIEVEDLFEKRYRIEVTATR